MIFLKKIYMQSGLEKSSLASNVRQAFGPGKRGECGHRGFLRQTYTLCCPFETFESKDLDVQRGIVVNSIVGHLAR